MRADFLPPVRDPRESVELWGGEESMRPGYFGSQPVRSSVDGRRRSPPTRAAGGGERIGTWGRDLFRTGTAPWVHHTRVKRAAGPEANEDSEDQPRPWLPPLKLKKGPTRGWTIVQNGTLQLQDSSPQPSE